MSFNLPDINIYSNKYTVTFNNKETKTFEKEIEVLNKINTILHEQGEFLSDVNPESKAGLHLKIIDLKKRYNEKTNIIIRLFQRIFGNPAEQKVSQIQTQLGLTEKDIIESLKTSTSYYDSLPPDCQLNPEDYTLERLSEIYIQAKNDPNNLPPEIIKKITLKIEQKKPEQLEGKKIQELEKQILISYSKKGTKKQIANLIASLSYQPYSNESLQKLETENNNEKLIEYLTFALITLVQDEDVP